MFLLVPVEVGTASLADEALLEVDDVEDVRGEALGLDVGFSTIGGSMLMIARVEAGFASSTGCEGLPRSTLAVTVTVAVTVVGKGQRIMSSGRSWRRSMAAARPR